LALPSANSAPVENQEIWKPACFQWFSQITYPTPRPDIPDFAGVIVAIDCNSQLSLSPASPFAGSSSEKP
jgi:hypothetical protein